jgi:hypothetical protein
MLLLAAGAAGYCAKVRRDGLTPEERALLAGFLLYTLALAYVTVQSHIFRHGESAGASVWYTQVLLAPLIALWLRGVVHLGRFGKIVATAALLVWTYVLCATYLVKLIPLYSGYEGPANPARLLDWYRKAFAASPDPLSYTALLSPAAVYVMTALCVASAIGLCVAMSVLFLRNPPEEYPKPAPPVRV